MKRKVNLAGPTTLTVSLPSKWAKQHNIKKGDEIEVEDIGNSLTISKEKKSRKLQRATINLDRFDCLLVNRFVCELYRQGAEEIVIQFTKEKIPDYKNRREMEIDKHIKWLVQRFIGMEIVSQTKNKIVLQSLMADEEQSKIDIVQKRIYFLTKEFLEEFISAMDATFSKFHERSYDYHDNIAKFTYYYLRLLNFSDLSEDKKSRLFGLFMIIDKMMDKVRHASERVSEMKCATPKIRVSVKEIFSFFLEEFEAITRENYSLDELEALVKKRYSIVKRINSEKYSYEEMKVIAECKIMLDTIVDFSETYAALHLPEYIKER